MKLAIVDGCPVPASIAPYIARVLKAAGQDANSIYRGEDAKMLLHKHGKSTQAELFAKLPPGVANPPGRSSHELRSDGKAWPGPIGRRLDEWQVGVDSGSDSASDAVALTRAAARMRWPVKHPYKTAAERHHWNFVRRPRPRNPVQARHIVAERAALMPAPRRSESPAFVFRSAHRVSLRGAAFIARFEGGASPDGMFRPYFDEAGGVWTIGFGHTAGVTKFSAPLTLQRATELLRRDLDTKYGAAVNRLRIRLSQKQFDAIVSCVYNVGPGILGGSSSLGATLRRYAVNRTVGNRNKVAHAIKKYDRGGGVRLLGLTRRRAAEAALFLGGTYR